MAIHKKEFALGGELFFVYNWDYLPPKRRLFTYSSTFSL